MYVESTITANLLSAPPPLKLPKEIPASHVPDVTSLYLSENPWSVEKGTKSQAKREESSTQGTCPDIFIYVLFSKCLHVLFHVFFMVWSSLTFIFQRRNLRLRKFTCVYSSLIGNKWQVKGFNSVFTFKSKTYVSFHHDGIDVESMLSWRFYT